MLDLARADRRKIVSDQASWFPTLFEGINPAAAGRWQREMPPRAQRLFAALAADELAAHGYPPGEARGPTPAQERAFRYHNQLMRNVNFLRLRLVQERGRELRFALARRLRDPVKKAR
jgi:hypothetical protein